ncbi:MAG: hypothetical protein DRN96_03645 [Thermoproteota archaeon]|nr:MAG: hypothetical protein DRN96_03645 [Candidatus Korarchaeota archaeon]
MLLKSWLEKLQPPHGITLLIPRSAAAAPMAKLATCPATAPTVLNHRMSRGASMSLDADWIRLAAALPSAHPSPTVPVYALNDSA